MGCSKYPPLGITDPPSSPCWSSPPSRLTGQPTMMESSLSSWSLRTTRSAATAICRLWKGKASLRSSLDEKFHIKGHTCKSFFVKFYSVQKVVVALKLPPLAGRRPSNSASLRQSPSRSSIGATCCGSASPLFWWLLSSCMTGVLTPSMVVSWWLKDWMSG